VVGKIALIATLALGGAAACAWTPDIPREDLHAKYLNAQTDLVEVGGTTLHVRDTGPRDAETVVLIHGFGSSLHTWQGWAEVLESDYRTVRFDMPGAGLSPADPTDDYTDPRVVSLLVGLMDRLQIENAVLVGNSIGGRVAWRMAAEHPNRVTGLVLVAPDGFESPTFRYDEAPEVPAIMHASKVFLPRWAVRPNLAVAYADAEALDEATLERYHDLLLAPGNRGALIARMEQTVLTDPVPFLESIDVPVLLLWGEEDGMIPVENAQDYLTALPDARLVRLPDLGHVPMEEGPARSLEPVLEFLEGRNDS